jgi:hypothetical protein
VRCEARKIPAAGEVFSLDFYLYRTNQLRKVRLSGESDRNGSYETDAFGNLFDVMKRNAP